jgi:hypothetical protein
MNVSEQLEECTGYSTCSVSIMTSPLLISTKKKTIIQLYLYTVLRIQLNNATELSSFSEAASCAASRTSQHVMETAGSLPCSQKPSTDPYTETDRSSSSSLSIHLRLSLPIGLFPSSLLALFFSLHTSKTQSSHWSLSLFTFGFILLSPYI